MFSWIEIIGHFSNAIMAFGTGFRNIVYLRLSLITASGLEIIYNFFVAGRPLWSPILWSSAIIAINVFQIFYILYQKRFLNLTSDERKVFNMIGSKMDILNFKKFM